MIRSTLLRTFALAILTSLLAISASSAATPAVGSSAPAFTLNSGDGTPTSLADYKGHWVVLYFYPKDFTGGCTLEAHNFQRDLAKYQAAGATILGVSVDSVQSHKDFCAKEGLNFKLLSDSEGKVSTAYDSLKEYEGAKMSARNTFLIDPDGNVAEAFIGVKPAEHSEEVLAALAKHAKP